MSTSNSTLGEIRQDGRVLVAICRGRPRFLRPELLHRRHISAICSTARNRSKNAGLPFDLDVDYLIGIWPDDGLCPIFDRPMEWRSSNRNFSPSLDRRVPSLGYTRGNVAWMSLEANRIKDNASAETLSKLLNYVQMIPT